MNIREIIDDCILYDPCRGAVKDLADGNVNVGRVAGELLDFAAEYGVTGNLWHHYIAFLLATDENPFSLACERRAAPEGSLKDVAANDLKAIFELFSIDLVELFGKFAPAISDYTYVGDGKRSRTSAGARVSLLSKALESANDDAAAIVAIADWYSIYGVGEYALYDAFRLISSSGSTEIDLQHITDTETKKLSDLVGYELQKKQLLDNTLAFLDGNSANNVLLYGDGGTGKSSSIKALMCEYAERGLRVIEVFKHQFTSISQLIAKIKDRNYRFILYLDDLSFEEFEIEYKYFKAIIEGGLECRPSNVQALDQGELLRPQRHARRRRRSPPLGYARGKAVPRRTLRVDDLLPVARSTAIPRDCPSARRSQGHRHAGRRIVPPRAAMANARIGQVGEDSNAICRFAFALRGHHFANRSNQHRLQANRLQTVFSYERRNGSPSILPLRHDKRSLTARGRAKCPRRRARSFDGWARWVRQFICFE